MTAARQLADRANQNTLAVDTSSNEVGIASTVPSSTLDVRGEVRIGTAIKAGVTGIVTVGTGVTVYGNAGIVSATSFYGDGSNLDGVTSSGLGTALNADDATLPETTPLQYIFKASRILHIGAGTSVRVDSDATSGNIAFMREADTFIGSGATFTIGAGTTLISDALGLFKPVV